jgi:hypothetical protein
VVLFVNLGKLDNHDVNGVGFSEKGTPTPAFFLLFYYCCFMSTGVRGVKCPFTIRLVSGHETGIKNKRDRIL